jgi:hypothetical protein
MLLTNKATPTLIGRATLVGKGIRLFIPSGFESGLEVFLTLSLALSLLIGGFAASLGFGLAIETLGADEAVLLVVSGLV